MNGGTRCPARGFVHSAGALVVSLRGRFAWSELARLAAITRRHGCRADVPLAAPGPEPPLDQVDSWIAVHADDTVTLFSGKVELGTGVQTALSQLVADELDVESSRDRRPRRHRTDTKPGFDDWQQDVARRRTSSASRCGDGAMGSSRARRRAIGSPIDNSSSPMASSASPVAPPRRCHTAP